MNPLRYLNFVKSNLLIVVLDLSELFVWLLLIPICVDTRHGPIGDVITKTGLGIDFFGVTFNGDVSSKINYHFIISTQIHII